VEEQDHCKWPARVTSASCLNSAELPPVCWAGATRAPSGVAGAPSARVSLSLSLALVISNARRPVARLCYQEASGSSGGQKMLGLCRASSTQAARPDAHLPLNGQPRLCVCPSGWLARSLACWPLLLLGPGLMPPIIIAIIMAAVLVVVFFHRPGRNLSIKTSSLSPQDQASLHKSARPVPPANCLLLLLIPRPTLFPLSFPSPNGPTRPRPSPVDQQLAGLAMQSSGLSVVPS